MNKKTNSGNPLNPVDSKNSKNAHNKVSKMTQNISLTFLLVSVIITGFIVFNYYNNVNVLPNLSKEDELSMQLFESSKEELKAEKIYPLVIPRKISGKFGDLISYSTILQIQKNTIEKGIDFDKIVNTIKSTGQWNFKGTTLEQVRAIFVSAGMDNKTIQILLDNTSAMPNQSGFVTKPPDAVFESFTADFRKSFYRVIGQYPDNPTYSSPFHYNSPSPDDWFYESDLPTEVLAKLRQQIFIVDNVCRLTDVHLVAPLMHSRNDWALLMQTLFRSPALDVLLHVDYNQDITSLVEYWGNLNREKFVRPILDAARKNPVGENIDIVTLLPKLPRDRINKFSITNLSTLYRRDCFWAMCNFFNEYPDERKDLSYFNELAKPLPSGDTLNFGDAVCLIDKNQKNIHGCIYIAEDLVYTKNGENSITNNVPFKFMYLKDVERLYSESMTNIVYYKRINSNSHLLNQDKIN